ncbi:MAG: GMC family oxidoreductase [Bradymonadaceae bacterium]|nr:GMC family oxidoreductase [Lujinxingiaceae bacterium]
MIRKTVDYVVVGSGPGGATLVRELARAGKQVLLLERGRDWRGHPLYATYPGALLYADRYALLFSREGLNIVRPLMLGGATGMYCGCAAMPLPFWKQKHGIDLDAHARATYDELKIAPLPAHLRGEASTRIAHAGAELGMDWQAQDKFMQPALAKSFDCSATCMLGCRCGAKWNAAQYVDAAVVDGCELWTRARVDRVDIVQNRATGVSGHIGNKPFEITANTVILAAGGIGTTHILQASGLDAAGQGMAMDTTAMVYGVAPTKGIGADPPMTWSYADDDLGVLYSTLIDPWLMYPLIMATKGPTYPLSWRNWGRTYGIMIKLKDDISGSIDKSGISKGLTTRDRARLSSAEQIARDILQRAGCDPTSFLTTPLRGTHPSATVRISEMVTTDLETSVADLYVCDASVFPEALARPTVITIIALAKRLALHLTTATTKPEDLRRLRELVG